MKTNKNHNAVTTITGSKAETTSLADLEAIISSHFTNHLLASKALSTIRDKQLYKGDYKSFEEYCLRRWGYSRSYGLRLADMHGVMTDLEKYKNTEVYPQNEAQARVYAGLDKTKRLKLIEAVKKDGEEETLTAEVLAKIKMKLFPAKVISKPKAPATPAPSLGCEIQAALEAATKLHQTLLAHETECDLVVDLAAFIAAAKSAINPQPKAAN